MRTIKFRALKDDISECIFKYGQLVYDAIGQPRITEVDKSGQGLTFHTCIHGTESQFTGLHDKNGNEIYEGDVIQDTKHSSEKGVVKFAYGQYVSEYSNNKGMYSLHGRLFYRPIIIGNIYENPELIKP